MTIISPTPGRQPLKFSGQIRAYSNNSTYIEREIVDTDTRVITKSNPNPEDKFYINLSTGDLPVSKVSPNGTVRYEPTGTQTNPQQYRNVK